MLSNQHFYHRTIRKMVVAFGTMFNNIKMVRYNQAGTTEIERINVPISYANKEKFYKRIIEDPNLANQTFTVLPRMAFEMTALTYDPLRKISSQIDLYEAREPSNLARIKMVPYSFDFNLSIYVRNTEDGTQIVEQILPYFTPDYTVSVDFGAPNMDSLILDIPIVLESVSYQPDYEGGSDSTRVLMWNLNFVMKGYLFGPISQVAVIKRASANVYDSTFETRDLKKMYLDYTGAGHFKVGELAYQGTNLDGATASGYVRSWNHTQNVITLYDTTGTFTTNTDLIGVVSNARYPVDSFDLEPNKIINIDVVPDPPSAEIGDDYGFTTTITEF